MKYRIDLSKVAKPLRHELLQFLVVIAMELVLFLLGVVILWR